MIVLVSMLGFTALQKPNWALPKNACNGSHVLDDMLCTTTHASLNGACALLLWASHLALTVSV